MKTSNYEKCSAAPLLHRRRRAAIYDAPSDPHMAERAAYAALLSAGFGVERIGEAWRASGIVQGRRVSLTGPTLVWVLENLRHAPPAVDQAPEQTDAVPDRENGAIWRLT